MEATTLYTQACKGYMGSNFLQHMLFHIVIFISNKC
jgi:hypothetical protein